MNKEIKLKPFLIILNYLHKYSKKEIRRRDGAKGQREERESMRQRERKEIKMNIDLEMQEIKREKNIEITKISYLKN